MTSQKRKSKKYIEYVINSIHGKNSEAAEQKEKRTYSIDAAAYLIGFIAQIDDSLETIKAINEENRSRQITRAITFPSTEAARHRR